MACVCGPAAGARRGGRGRGDHASSRARERPRGVVPGWFDRGRGAHPERRRLGARPRRGLLPPPARGEGACCVASRGARLSVLCPCLRGGARSAGPARRRAHGRPRRPFRGQTRAVSFDSGLHDGRSGRKTAFGRRGLSRGCRRHGVGFSRRECRGFGSVKRHFDRQGSALACHIDLRAWAQSAILGVNAVYHGVWRRSRGRGLGTVFAILTALYVDTRRDVVRAGPARGLRHTGVAGFGSSIEARSRRHSARESTLRTRAAKRPRIQE